MTPVFSQVEATSARADGRHALAVCGATDIGLRRERNEDTFVIADLATGELSVPCARTELLPSGRGLLMLVCDGMGGAAAGEVAARIAAESIKHGLEEQGAAVRGRPAASLEGAVRQANQAILREVAAHPEERGMGTTCTAALIFPDKVVFAQVGDSRAYLLRGGALTALTRDQTLTAQLLDAGALLPDQVPGFRFRHVLLQALGSTARVDPVISEQPLAAGDRILLCSDGLHGVVNDETIARALRETPDSGDAAQALVGLALAAGGPDNVTVVVADWAVS
jgi:serine/threonine protein phosphatase PrpC